VSVPTGTRESQAGNGAGTAQGSSLRDVTSPYDLSREDFAAHLEGVPNYRVNQILEGLWQQDRRFSEMTSLPLALRTQLEEDFPLALTVTSEVATDAGETMKWLFTLADGATIETVLMAYQDRVTVCVSTQAGCAMNCSFCATGQAGFTRHLTAGEVLEQVAFAARTAAPRRLSNVVFMGMGEPLANYDVTTTVVKRLHAERGMSARHLTVSTVGIAPAIERLAGEGLPLTLAVSLHVANDAQRDKLVPINRRYNLDRLAIACHEWVGTTNRRLSFEWALIDGLNDTPEAAKELLDYARPLQAHINLIPLNPTPGYPVVGSSMSKVRLFADMIEAGGLTVTTRATRGRSIAAACGQLAEVTRGKRARIPVSSE